MTNYPPGSTAKVYQDSDGNELSLRRLIKDEPEWAHSRIVKLEKLEAVLDEAINTSVNITNFSYDEHVVEMAKHVAELLLNAK